MGRRAVAGGFTLVELLVSMAVMAILLTLAVPAFSEAMVSSRLTSVANSFLSHLYLARSEAIKRNGRAVLCKSADGLACSGSGGWHQGWILFHDANNNAGSGRRRKRDPDSVSLALRFHADRQRAL